MDVMNKDKKLTRYDVQISKLIGKAWGKAASIAKGVSVLRSGGIYPYDPNAIPEHYFSLSDAIKDEDLVANKPNEEDEVVSFPVQRDQNLLDKGDINPSEVPSADTLRGVLAGDHQMIDEEETHTSNCRSQI
ncbi:unnamed protein product [Acanthoscelides obtectus]|uniref:Uncharacterized protein n=1 Tax=Acanthoscelides obtectus TaxID=200917 RepID=A0A9P0KQM8_ACAOB|nr:unnamed protein product [Acanthoscelides obtectus]CAK1639590.1 hypothetical protein AOBTE_LOCUS11257 [Acanthoscelides obtectus]